MVGDSYADDIEGARALGMRAILLDRDGLHPRRARPHRRSRALPPRSASEPSRTAAERMTAIGGCVSACTTPILIGS